MIVRIIQGEVVYDHLLSDFFKIHDYLSGSCFPHFNSVKLCPLIGFLWGLNKKVVQIGSTQDTGELSIHLDDTPQSMELRRHENFQAAVNWFMLRKQMTTWLSYVKIPNPTQDNKDWTYGLYLGSGFSENQELWYWICFQFSRSHSPNYFLFDTT